MKWLLNVNQSFVLKSPIGFSTGMGVVVQEMVASEAAGVLFTVNPVDGNPARMIITANFGLGESVVSARAEPDTVELQRSFDGHVQVVERRLGSKQLTVVMDETGATTRTFFSSCITLQKWGRAEKLARRTSTSRMEWKRIPQINLGCHLLWNHMIENNQDI